MRTAVTIISRRVIPALVLLFLLQACQKDDEFGLDIISLPGDRFTMGFTDTVSIVAWSSFEDSLQTSGVVNSLLGSFHDPLFGRTTASLYTQALLSTSNVSFGNNPVGDSLHLTLRFNGHYGDSRSRQRVRVYEIDPGAEFHSDTTYYSNRQLPLGNLLFDDMVEFNAVDSTTFNGVRTPPLVRIRLNNLLLQKFIDASGTGDLLNNTAFREFFKGLYVTIEPDNSQRVGTMGYFNMNADLTGLTLFYHNDMDTLSYPFVINDECARFSHFDHHGYQFAEAGLLQQDTLGNNPRLYLQPNAGVKLNIRMPHLKDLVEEGTKGITRAELILKADPSDHSASVFAPPQRLSIARLNEEGRNVFITDFYEGETFMGGNWDPVKREYRFRITRHMQDMLNEKYPNNGLVVMVGGASVLSNRVVLKGNSPGEQNVRLEIVFANP